MKNLITIGACLISAICLADRVDTWLASSVNVKQATLTRTASGGCTVQAMADVTNAAGKTITVMSAPTSVAGANLTECLDILDTKAPVLFKNDQGL